MKDLLQNSSRSMTTPASSWICSEHQLRRDIDRPSYTLYSLLASLVQNRALSVVRATPNSDGYEALRQLILSLKPNAQTRGLALLPAITSYPSFIMNKPLLSQLMRLEEMFEETRKSGTPVQEELKVAILLKCIRVHSRPN